MPSTHLSLNFHVILSTRDRVPECGRARDRRGLAVEFLRESGIEYGERYLW